MKVSFTTKLLSLLAAAALFLPVSVATLQQASLILV